MLIIFKGLTRENPNKHLNEFHVVCANINPVRITKEKIKLKTFPFLLAHSTKEWHYYLPFRYHHHMGLYDKGIFREMFLGSKAILL